ncbi:hypothetical protein JKP88DRAFT_351307 [Tribonema minus]|uniref:K Homology domain-containing protein n=1 Tax=Tribonema minus TaxID=303371 RepID=A0A835YRS0_9STRA|nr:hypothetical protein JKP88DRAFT_351307 [Tribonema minus]
MQKTGRTAAASDSSAKHAPEGSPSPPLARAAGGGSAVGKSGVSGGTGADADGSMTVTQHQQSSVIGPADAVTPPMGAANSAAAPPPIPGVTPLQMEPAHPQFAIYPPYISTGGGGVGEEQPTPTLSMHGGGPATFGDLIDTRFLDSPMPDTAGSGLIGFPVAPHAFSAERHDHHRPPQVFTQHFAPPPQPFPGAYANMWPEGVPLGMSPPPPHNYGPPPPPGYAWPMPPPAHHPPHMPPPRMGGPHLGPPGGPLLGPPGGFMDGGLGGHHHHHLHHPHHPPPHHPPAIPTVLEKFPGFVRCVIDIAPEVVGWVIGRSGSHIKEMKHRSGCGMWVDQKDLKLYITGTDMPRIHIAAGMVADLISKAPVNMNAAGVDDEVVSQMIDCPPHLIGLLIGRGGSTIKRIKEESRANVVINQKMMKRIREESRANVVINQKMMKVIVSGIAQSVRLAVAMIEDVFSFGKAADEQHHHAATAAAAAAATSTAAAANQHFPLQGTAQDYMEYGSDVLEYSLAGANGGAAGPASGGSGASSTVTGGSNAAAVAAAAAAAEEILRPRSASASAALQGTYTRQWMFKSAALQGAYTRQGACTWQSSRHGPNAMAKRLDGAYALEAAAAVAAAGRSAQHEDEFERARALTSTRGVGGAARMREEGLGSASSAGSGGAGSGGVSDWSVFSAALFCLASETDEHGGGGSGGSASGRTEHTQEGHMLRMAGVGEGGRGSKSAGGSPPNKPPVVGPIVKPVTLEAYLDAIPPGLGGYTEAFKATERPSFAVAALGAAAPVDLRGDENEIDIEAMRLMGATDFVEIGIPKGPAVKIAYTLRENRPPPGGGSPLTARQFLTSLGLVKALGAQGRSAHQFLTPLGLVKFLTSLGLAKYAAAFEDALVDLPALAAMREQDLVDLGVVTVEAISSDLVDLGVVKGPRLKIMAELHRLFSDASARAAPHASWTPGIVPQPPPTRLYVPRPRSSNSDVSYTSVVSSVSSCGNASGGRLARSPGSRPRAVTGAQVSPY